MKHSTPNMEATRTGHTALLARTARHGRDVFQRSIRRLSFWAAILLPALYLPLLYVGIGARTGGVFLALLGLQLIALFVGHGYNQP